MDDLLFTAYRRRIARVEAVFEHAMASGHPLHAFWQWASDPTEAVLTMEYLTLSNHTDMIRRETITFGERSRRAQVYGWRTHAR